MSRSTSLVSAVVLTLLCILFFVIASPLVPMASQLAWLWIALATGAVATFAWISAWRSMAEQDQRTFHS